MPNIEPHTPIAVALLYQVTQLGGHLKDALQELGAQVVYEARTADIDRDLLERSGARVVVVNLDSETESHIDHVYDLLGDGDYEVVFNDAAASASLQGWDQARWARHLAAKILNRPEAANPPRPAGAEAVPTPAQRAAEDVPDFKMLSSAPSVQQTMGAHTQASNQTSQRASDSVANPVGSRAEFDVALIPENLAAPASSESSASDVDTMEAGFAAELDTLFSQTETSSMPGVSSAPVHTSDHDSVAPHESSNASLNPTGAAPLVASSEGISVSSDAGFDPEELRAMFPSMFDHFDQAAAEIPKATDSTYKPAPLPPRNLEADNTAVSGSPLPDWSLEPLQDNDQSLAGPRPSASGIKSDFGIQKISAAEYLAPPEEASDGKQFVAMPSSEFSLELMPMEEAVAPQPHTGEEDAFTFDLREAPPKPKPPFATQPPAGIQQVIVLGASIGGPEAIREFLGAFPARFPALFVLVQHMSAEFLEMMVSQLTKATALTVRSPGHGERVGNGDVLIVPITHRFQVKPDGGVVLSQLPGASAYHPSIDLALHDIADHFGGKATAIIFSGMAHDAIEGSQYLAEKGGTIWAQDPETCVISSMVDGVRAAGVVSFIGSPKQLAEKIIAEAEIR